MKKIIITALLVLFIVNGYSWGFFAHKLINKLAVFTLPDPLLDFYKFHIEFITDHAPDPDKRRYSVKEEGCRHYIDIDDYEQVLPLDTIPRSWKNAVEKYSEDSLNIHGIVPWYIQLMKLRLTDAFKKKDIYSILKLSAEIGHYIADAHVPLHTTRNHNGQLTGQTGIHSFWESRLPELFSENYHLFTGKAFYLDNVQESAWKAVEGSFSAKDSVLEFEKILNEHFESDKKYELHQKGRRQVKVFSEAYAAEYQKMLKGQVERRLKVSILLVGCIWYTAWVDAGQPDLKGLEINYPEKQKKKKHDDDEVVFFGKKMIGRSE